MIKEIVYSVLFNHPDRPIGPKTGPQDTWSTSYPDKLEFKDIDKHLELLQERHKAIFAKITTYTVEVEEDGYFNLDEATKKTEYEWKSGKPVTKIREKEIQY